ncbi:MAG: hypothetical protein KIH08_14050 [Candidatus Freyarchaeota archaeon]|nr:hypothetical protein [Candidatus Jordarchaeia archaeon]MBS7267416.1 hypothetical protein [Candidatus Jordarchaeia archaeon]MBS7278721.1 hypothetical protein [Candidatus Jordarchaeia archaeon]
MVNVYWLLTNPLTYNLLNTIFGILLMIGVGMFIMNLALLAVSHRRLSYMIGIIVSLLLVGVSSKWQLLVPVIIEISGGVTQYLGIYLYQLINQWLTQNPVPKAILSLI